MGYKDVRLRLKQMASGEQFSFVVEKKIGLRMDRVIAINDGRAVSVEEQGEDLVYTVERT
jgi:hypothetical protein